MTAVIASPAMRRLIDRGEQGGPDQFSGPDHGRERHRQGTDRARRPPLFAARRQAVYRRELRRASRTSDGERAFRLRKRRFQRRREHEAGPVRSGAHRNSLSRRDRRTGQPDAGQAAARAGRPVLFPPGRFAQGCGRRPHRGGDESRISTKRCRAASSGGICFTASMHFTCTCRRCGSAWKTSGRSPVVSARSRPDAER